MANKIIKSKITTETTGSAGGSVVTTVSNAVARYNNQITRPTGTTQYSIGDALSSATSGVFVISLGTNLYGKVIRGGTLTSSKASGLSGTIYVSASNPGSITDNDPYNPSAVVMQTRVGGMSLGTGNTSTAPQVWHRCFVDSDIFIPAGVTTIYCTLVFSALYTPDASQTFTLTVDVIE